MKAGKQEMIRDLNTRLVLEAIIQHDPISRAELSNLLGLTKATVSSIVTRLGTSADSRDRQPRHVQRSKTHYAYIRQREWSCPISIDLTGKQIILMTCNLRGENCRLYQYANHYSPQALLTPLKKIIHTIMDELPANRSRSSWHHRRRPRCSS